MATDAWTPPFEPALDAPAHAHDPAIDAAAPAPPAPTPSSVSSLSARPLEDQLSFDIKHVYACINVLKDFAFDPIGDPPTDAKQLRLLLRQIPIHNTSLADPRRPATLADSRTSTAEQRSLPLRLLHNLIRGDARAFITDNTGPLDINEELHQQYALETDFDLQQQVQTLSFNDEGRAAKLLVKANYLWSALDPAGLPLTGKAKRSHILRAIASDRTPPEVALIYAQTAQQMSVPGCALT